MKNLLLIGTLGLSVFTLANSTESKNTKLPINDSVFAHLNDYVGKFTAEGKTFETKYVRVLFAAEGSEKEGESNSIKPLIYESVNPEGQKVKVRKFQITTKNTGYDEIQTSKEEDYKLKNVKEGAKLHIEIPIYKNGNLILDQAYVGNAAYNFGTKETRQNLSSTNAKDLKIKITNLELPKYNTESKPGDKGLIYNQGYINLTFSAKVKEINSDQISDFTIAIDGPISVTHIRGKEREKNAVNIDPQIVALNIK